MKKLLSFALLLAFLSCSSQDCKTLPKSFNSYESAIKQVKGASFKIKETANTSGSSWMQAASFYSCDGAAGFFIYRAKGREYIHAAVPVEIWKGFKSASSKGEFYNQQIKDKYRLVL